MKAIKTLTYTALSFFAASGAWGTATPIDVTIYFNQLKDAGIRNVAKVRSDLGLGKDQRGSEALVIRHVITTGRDRADRNSILLNIPTLEKIQPPLSSSNIISKGKQTALTDAQIKSVMSMLRMTESQGKWMSNSRQKKYIGVVLQKKNSTDNRVSPLSIRKASSLVQWAIKMERLLVKDHPASTSATTARQTARPPAAKPPMVKPATPRPRDHAPSRRRP